MQKILIVKTGSTVKSLLDAGEDFEHWFVQGCGLAENQYEVKSVFAGAGLSSPSDYSGIIVSGSPAYVTDLAPWSENTAEFLHRAVELKVPVLGICYGHQLLAHALGGTVDFHPGGREIGTVAIQLNEHGQADSLLRDLPVCFSAQVSHSQTVTRLPKNACLLAGNEFEPHHAFRVGENAWGLQFHPEFSQRVIKAYIDERRAELVSERLDPDQLLRNIRPATHAASLLKRFVEMAFEN